MKIFQGYRLNEKKNWGKYQNRPPSQKSLVAQYKNRLLHKAIDACSSTANVSSTLSRILHSSAWVCVR